MDAAASRQTAGRQTVLFREPRDAIGNTIGNLVADRISRGGASKNGSDDPAKLGDATEGGPATTGAGDGTAAQPTVGAGGGQIGDSGDIVVTARRSGGGLAGPDYLNPPERAPTSLAQLDIDEANIEAANNAYRSSHNGQDYADYQKYKDNIAGWRQTLGQDQSQPVVTVRPAQGGSGGWYADFGLGILGGFNLHVDRGGVTGSVGAGLFGRMDVGYAYDEKALVGLRQENRVFVSGKMGKNGLGYGLEASDAGEDFSATVGPAKITVDKNLKPSVGTAFDVGHGDATPTLSLDGKTASFGFEGGIGWLHTGKTRAWAFPK